MKLAEKKGTILREIIPHIIVWIALFAFPILFADTDLPIDAVVYVKRWVPLFFSALVFYINYNFLINAFLFRNKFTYFIIANVVVITLCVIANEQTWNTIYNCIEIPPTNKTKVSIGFMRYRSAFSFVLTSGFSVAIRATKRWMKSEAEKKNLENEHLKSEINHLRYQLQPHFFFNSLNTIYSLIDTTPAKAKDAVHGLAKLMRYVLYETTDEKIKLSKEIAFLQNYIRIMEMRLPVYVQLNSKFPTLTTDYEIAPLLFVALVENAFKHGVSISKSVVNIEMKIENNKLHFVTENTLFAQNRDDKSDSGIGLDNLKKRLALLYSRSFNLKQEAKNELYRVELILDL
jgi:LytS/YehU family sensor histidine kinase